MSPASLPLGHRRWDSSVLQHPSVKAPALARGVEDSLTAALTAFRQKMRGLPLFHRLKPANLTAALIALTLLAMRRPTALSLSLSPIRAKAPLRGPLRGNNQPAKAPLRGLLLRRVRHRCPPTTLRAYPKGIALAKEGLGLRVPAVLKLSLHLLLGLGV